MTFDLISGLHMKIQTWHPPLRLCIHAKYYVKSGLTNVLTNANTTKNMHLFSIRIANYIKLATKNDSTLTSVIDRVHRGWPEHKREIPIEIREYWTHRDELSINEGLLMKGTQIVIP